ncbi:hypothetical protein BT69DRAFT_1346206 [Atractiella rhizophila]|nr:hypothetical protein BT69DRAFT_1346206 [Atractiella rhizophila]
MATFSLPDELLLMTLVKVFKNTYFSPQQVREGCLRVNRHWRQVSTEAQLRNVCIDGGDGHQLQFLKYLTSGRRGGLVRSLTLDDCSERIAAEILSNILDKTENLECLTFNEATFSNVNLPLLPRLRSLHVDWFGTFELDLRQFAPWIFESKTLRKLALLGDILTPYHPFKLSAEELVGLDEPGNTSDGVSHERLSANFDPGPAFPSLTSLEISLTGNAEEILFARSMNGAYASAFEASKDTLRKLTVYMDLTRKFSFPEFTTLTFLECESHSPKGNILQAFPNLPQMKDLRHLSLIDCSLHLVTTANLQLRKLELTGCIGLYRNYESMFSNCTKTLQYLTLSDSSADDIETEDEFQEKFIIFFSASLSNLTVSSWSHTESLFAALSPLSHLRFLHLEASPWILDNTYSLFSSLPQCIQSFELGCTEQLEVSPRYLDGFKYLVSACQKGLFPDLTYLRLLSKVSPPEYEDQLTAIADDLEMYDIFLKQLG